MSYLLSLQRLFSLEHLHRLKCLGRKASSLLSGLAFAAVLSACGGGGGGTPEPTAKPQPTSGATPSSTPSPSPTTSPTPPPKPTQPPIATGWEDPLIISAPRQGGNGGARVGIDALGQSLTVWKQDTKPGTVLWSSRFVPGLGWGAPLALYRGLDSVPHHELAMAQSNGKAMLVWTQINNAGAYSVVARAYNSTASTWSAPSVVSNETRTMSQPSVDIDATGNAAVVWTQLDTRFRYNVVANRYTGSGNWGSSTVVGSTTVSGSTDLNAKVAMTGSGEAVAVWRRSGNSERGFWSSRASAGGNWDTGARIVDIPGFGSSNLPGAYEISTAPEIAADGNGNAMLAWSQVTVNPIQSHMRSLRYSAGAWSTVQQAMNVPVGQNALPFVRLKINPQGQAVAAWVTDGVTKIWANRSRSDGTWETAQVVNATATGTIGTQPNVGIDDQGAMSVVWTQSGIMGNRFEPATGWGVAQRLENYDPTTSISADPVIAMNARGYASLVWTQVLDLVSIGSQIAGRFYNSGR